jgi:LDH2 family malate/lactate/ureidoglycolate dehydrogenase
MTRVPIEVLVEFGVSVLTRKGVPAAPARHVSEIVVRTEAMGIKTHGMIYLSYADSSIPGLVNPTAEPAVVRDKGAVAVVDGKRGIAHLAMRVAADLAVRKAREHGIAMVGIKSSTWLGALAPYIVPIARQGLLAQMWAQTNNCKDCAPVGGIDATFSTNPVALAFPTGGDPVVADFSTATVAMAKVNQMVRLGTKAPEEIFMDKEGKLSTDASVVKAGGSILFTGGRNYGHKGYALSLWCEALTAVSGGECNNPTAETAQAFNLTVIDPAAFAGWDPYLAEMKRFVAHVQSVRRLPGVARIRLPGERAFESLRDAEARGVELDDHIAGVLAGLADRHGIPRVA